MDIYIPTVHESAVKLKIKPTNAFVSEILTEWFTDHTFRISYTSNIFLHSLIVHIS